MPAANLILTKFPWGRAYLAATWLYKNGRKRLEQNLTEHERRELWDLMRKSGGRRSALTSRQQKRFVGLARQGMTGRRA